MRLDDIIDDESIRVQTDTIEDIRIILNNTGKQNFRQKMEELKRFVIAKKINDDSPFEAKIQKAENNLKWLLQYILSKRLGSQATALLHIYVDMIRDLDISVPPLTTKKLTVVGLTILQASQIFKKCMLVDEDEFQKVSNAAMGTQSIIKNYLQSLGAFLGTLTVA